MSTFCPLNNCELCLTVLFALVVVISERIFCCSWAAWVELECSFYRSLFKHGSFSLMRLYIWIFVQGSWSSHYLGFGIDFQCWRFWVQDLEVWRNVVLELLVAWVLSTVFSIVNVLTYPEAYYLVWSLWQLMASICFSVGWFLWWSLWVSNCVLNWIVWLVIL